MSQQDALVAARVRARRRNTGIAMGFGLLLCLAGAVWAFSTLGAVGDRAAVELVPETTLPSIPDPAAAPVDGTTPPADATTAAAPAVPVTRFVSPSGQHRLHHQRAVRPLRRRGEVLGRRHRRRPTAPLGVRACVVVDASGPRVDLRLRLADRRRWRHARVRPRRHGR